MATRPTAEEIERIRRRWSSRPVVAPQCYDFDDMQSVLAEIDALREENRRLQHEVQWSRAAIAECLEHLK